MENKRFDAVVFFAAVKMDPPKNMLLPLRTLRVRNSIIEITDDIEAQTNTAVFEPTDAEGFLGTNECGKTYRKDEFGVDLWDVDVPEGLVGIPINKRYVASMRDDSIFRETRYMGHCLVAAVLVGGFALCRQVSPNLRKKDYYDLLRQTARVLDYGNDVRTRTVCFRSAVKALSL